MTNRKSIQVLSEKKTRFGYVIRDELWPALQAEVITFHGEDDNFTDALLQGAIDSAPRYTRMTTCYTNSGDWIGNVETAKFLCEDRGISPEHITKLEPGVLQPCNIGWCNNEKLWYGWSHRAIAGFGIGSSVERGDIAYVPTDWYDLQKVAIAFWQDAWKTKISAKRGHDGDDAECIVVEWTYADSVPNEKLRGTKGQAFFYPPVKWGNGAWTARTLDDARKMACDFAQNVS